MIVKVKYLKVFSITAWVALRLLGNAHADSETSGKPFWSWHSLKNFRQVFFARYFIVMFSRYLYDIQVLCKALFTDPKIVFLRIRLLSTINWSPFY